MREFCQPVQARRRGDRVHRHGEGRHAADPRRAVKPPAESCRASKTACLCRAGQVGIQNRMDQVLETGHLGNELCSSGYQATARLGFLVRHPDFRQKAARVELGQYCGVDLVGLTFAQAMARTRIGLAMTTRGAQPGKSEGAAQITTRARSS